MPYALREALAAFRRAPLLTGLSAAMVGMALFVVGIFSLVAFNLREALVGLEERVQIVAYLRDDARALDVTLSQDQLRRRPEVDEVRLVTKDQALARARADLPEFGDAFVGLEENPLPASLEIRLKEAFRTEDAIEEIAHEAALYPFVEDVQFGQEWVERLFLLRRIAGFTTLFLGAAFALVAALIIGTAIRIAIFARRDEISIMRLVGATNGFVARPFLLEGAITGLLGGAVALILTVVTHRSIQGFLFELAFIPGSWIVIGLLAGTFFGMASSALALRRYLREV
ncbi:MAG: permease-like cell division protein FtsX [Gemmatimonadota bacterium]